MAYVYAPLQADGRMIRLAKILPGQFDDDLRITLSQALLALPKSTSTDGKGDRDGGKVNCGGGGEDGDRDKDKDQDQDDNQDQPANGRFTALSYVWGSPENPKTIFVRNSDGEFGTLSVTRNLEEALRHLRWTDKPRVMWIDAICINQGDMDERSKQVIFMAQLYNLARDVVVWLGPERNDGEFALKMLKSWGDRIAVDWTKTSLKILDSHEDGQAEGGDADMELPLTAKSTQLNYRQGWALYHLMNREWFERLWVRQEVLADVPKSFRCGNAEFDSPALMRAIFMLQTKNIWINMAADFTLRFLQRRKLLYDLVVATADTRPLENLRFDLSGLSWGVPVDSIYASQNLLTALERNLDILPDYTLPAATVFQDVATKLVTYTEQLTLLHTCELGSKVIPELPSWVPDWSSQIKVAKMDLYWSASAWITAVCSFEPSPSGNILRAAGVRKATVRAVHDLATSPQNGENMYFRTGIHMWDILQREDDLSAPYFGSSGGDMWDAYTKTFAAEYCQERYNELLDKITLPQAREFIKGLKGLPSHKEIQGYIRSSGVPNISSYLGAAFVLFRGRSCITTEEGYIGLAPQDTQPGDVISVILGCRMPMLLRPVVDAVSSQSQGTEQESPTRWQVVGACYIPGLMNGEAIYGKLPEHVSSITKVFKLNMQRLGFKDSRTGEVEYNCVSILERYGLKADRVMLDPWRMHVSVAALKDKGIAVEMMDIV